MIKRLRLKFIVINMGIATILLSAILGLVFYFTSANLETESIRMMERIASQPFQMNAPGELGEDVRLPFFTLQLGPHGELLDASGGYYCPTTPFWAAWPRPPRPPPAAWGCWRSITCAITAPTHP